MGNCFTVVTIIIISSEGTLPSEVLIVPITILIYEIFPMAAEASSFIMLFTLLTLLLPCLLIIGEYCSQIKPCSHLVSETKFEPKSLRSFEDTSVRKNISPTRKAETSLSWTFQVPFMPKSSVSDQHQVRLS